jgi:coatomer subunit gamma
VLQAVASSALVAGLHLVEVNSEVVKRWAGEVQEAVHSKHTMVQYHAITLQMAIKSSDRLAISKILHNLTSSSVRSPMAQCLVVCASAQAAVPCDDPSVSSGCAAKRDE